ncbi:MAG: hypothetical protein GOV01_00630 [Candidatus Altiarchaeota archaeon]|nr:hypothetical protein [Candidatus Altiarchaeota archaeon]
MISKKHEQVALSYLIAGFFLSAFMFTRGLILPAVVQALAASIGALALVMFGGEISES